MKMILAFVIALSATSAMARVSVNTPWSELKKNYSLDIKWPAARMNHGPHTGVDFLCDAGDHFQALKPIKKCTKWEVERRRDGNIVCVSYESIYGTVEKVQSYERCVKYRHHRERDICLQYETRTFEVPSSYSVEVHKYVGSRNEDNTRLLFKKPFTIPACN